MKVCKIGGQAVMEGVMMKSATSMAVAVRRSDGSIVVEKSPISTAAWRKKIDKIPFVRGAVVLFDSMVQGTKLTMRSAEMYGEDAFAEEPTKFEKWLSEKLKVKLETLVLVLGVTLGLALFIGLFMILPTFLAGLLPKNTNPYLMNLFEGGIRIGIFIIYILLASLMQEIRRVFMYHGAEHKVISCYEHEKDLTPEEAACFTTSHPRCGTAFMLIVMVISVLVLGIFGWGPLYFRIPLRLLMLPIIAGISYEVLKVLAKSDNLFFRILRAPGMALQKLTTRQPDNSMLEVSLAAFKAVLVMDGLMEEEILPEPEAPAEETPAAIDPPEDAAPGQAEDASEPAEESAPQAPAEDASPSEEEKPGA